MILRHPASLTRWAILGPAAAALLLAATLAATEAQSQGSSCISQLRMKRLEMLRLAKRCDVDEGLIASIEAGIIVEDRGACSRPIGVSGQNEAFSECARVYLCASRAYTCAIQRAQQGEDCTSAATTCLATYPVPR